MKIIVFHDISHEYRVPKRKKVKKRIRSDDNAVSDKDYPPYSIPIQCDVRDFDFTSVVTDGTFDVILMDPPWKITEPNPVRGVC